MYMALHVPYMELIYRRISIILTISAMASCEEIIRIEKCTIQFIILELYNCTDIYTLNLIKIKDA